MLEELKQKLNGLFEPALTAEILEIGKFEEVPAGGTLIDYGQVMRRIPIIISGVVKVSRKDEDGKELFLYYVQSLESCAMTFTCCMQLQQSEINAIAEEDVKLFSIPVHVMEQWLVKYTTWKSFVMSTIQFRFIELLKTIDQIAFKKLDERLVNYLMEKSNTTGSSLLNVSHQLIADDLATSRVVVSRLLKQLENEKKILLYRNQIKLLRAFFTEPQLNN